MVFTRVILGNVEPLHCGSEQCHPSDEKYDSGVDDLKNPTQYVVWEMNMYTHIYPEFIVGFRIPPRAAGNLYRMIICIGLIILTCVLKLLLVFTTMEHVSSYFLFHVGPIPRLFP